MKNNVSICNLENFITFEKPANAKRKYKHFSILNISGETGFCLFNKLVPVNRLAALLTAQGGGVGLSVGGGMPAKLCAR